MDENKEFDNVTEPEVNDENTDVEAENTPAAEESVTEETVPAEEETAIGENAPAEEKPEAGNKEDKPKSKKSAIIAVIAAVAVIAAAAVCIACFGKGDKKNISDDTADVTRDVTAEVVSTDEVSADTTVAPETDKDGNAVTEKTSADTTKAPSGDEDADPDDVAPIDTYVEPVPEVIVEKSTDKSLWPADSLPDGIPPCKYIKIDTSTKTDDDGMIVWDVSWTTTEEDYEKWIKSFELNGFKASKKLGNYFANGKCVVAVSTEAEGKDVWVDMIVEQSTPVDYECSTLDGEFPVFKKGDATLEYWVERASSGTVRVQYACASDWQVLVAAYKTDLRNDGFTVDETHGYKDVLGVTYTVYFDGDMIKSPESLLYVVG